MSDITKKSKKTQNNADKRYQEIVSELKFCRQKIENFEKILEQQTELIKEKFKSLDYPENYKNFH